MAMLRGLMIVTLCCYTVVARDGVKAEREVNGNVLTSERDPRVRIELPRRVEYVGADRWPLYEIADCELHVFVEATPGKRVKRLYWVQFEAYLASRPELHHTYPFSNTETLNGNPFDVRARFGAGNERAKAGSDLEHVQAMVSARGYQLPEGMMNVRFVQLLDEQKRKELMIIYAEDLTPTGFTVKDLLPGGRHEAEWPAVEASLIERAKQAVTLH